METQESLFDSQVPWIGEIPSSWAIRKVKSEFESKKKVVGDDESKYERLALTLNGVIKRAKEDSTGLQPEKFETYQILEENELVFKLIDLQNVSTSRVGRSPYTGLVSPAYIVLHKKDDDDTRYAEYYFLSMWMNQVFNSLGDAGVRSSINASDLLNLPMPVPSAKEKKIISDYLDDVISQMTNLIKEEKESIEEYKQLKLSIISETVTKGIKKNVCFKDSGIASLGEIPEHWQRTKIRYLHNGLTDGTHGTFERVREGRYLLSSKNVRENSLEISDNESFISEKDYETITANGFPQKGDVLLCCIGASIGRCIVYELEETMAFQRSVIFIRPNDKITSKMLRYNMMSQSTLSQEQFLSNQSAQPGLYQGAVSEIFVTVPPIDEQKEIVEYLDEKCELIDSIINEKEGLIRDLEEMKRSTIFEYVTGKRKVV